MAVTRFDPFTALARFDREFDELVRRGWGGSSTRMGFVPPVELMTRETDVVIRLELPGVDVERDVAIEIDKGRLVVKGERRDERNDENGSYLVRELRFGSFRREFALPEGVSAEQVEAHYDQGMLEVVVRNVIQPEPRPQQVRIQTTGRGSSHAIEATATE